MTFDSIQGDPFLEMAKAMRGCIGFPGLVSIHMTTVGLLMLLT